MAISRLTGQDASGTSAAASVAATYASTPTQNNLLVAAVWANVLTTNTTITGWTLAVESVTGSTAANGSVALFYKVAGAGESTTVTANATGASVMRSQIYEYSGVATSSLTDGTSSANSGATTGMTQAAAAGGQLATTNANDLLLAAWGFSGSSTAPSVDSSFTIRQSTARLVSADLIVSSTGTYNPTLTWTTTALRSGGVIAAFEAAGGASLTADASQAVTATLTSTGTRTAVADATEAATAGLSSTATRTAVVGATTTAAATLTASATVTRFADATLAVTAAATSSATRTLRLDASLTVAAAPAATGTRTLVAAAQLASTATLTATGSTSVVTATPPERLWHIPAETRTHAVGLDDRTLAIPVESRTLTVRSSQ